MRVDLARDLAAYSQWMNERLYAACAGLSDAARRTDRGAFFGSIHGTLNHILLADRIWFGRFVEQPFHAERLDQELFGDFNELRVARAALDEQIGQWVGTLTDNRLAATLHYTSVSDPQPRRLEMSVAVSHFFNHQTHHRGQLTVLLSQCGVDYGVTDLIRLPQVVDRNAG